MIITVTLNPAMDRTLEAPGFRVGQHARARLVALAPAGKGINVARGLARLGSAARACGFVGRAEQETYARSLGEDGVRCDLCPVEGTTRTNTTILDPARHTTTHLREQGFAVSAEDIARLRSRLVGVIAEGRREGCEAPVAFSGSMPQGIGADEFAALLRDCRGAGAGIVLDTSGDAVRAAVESGCVHTLKVNLAELGECLGRPVGKAEASGRAGELLGKVDTVLLTLGAEGAYAILRDPGARGLSPLSVSGVCRLAEKELRSVLGCGDAFLAGWLHAGQTTDDVRQALRWAVAAGAASAMTDTAVGYTSADVEGLLERCELS